MVGGNVQATVQMSNGYAQNAIGERVPVWASVGSLWGWLDLQSGSSDYSNNAKIQQATHIFLCDDCTIDRQTDNKRLIVNNTIYDILYIDNPMELNAHMEIYLKYVGGVAP